MNMKIKCRPKKGALFLVLTIMVLLSNVLIAWQPTTDMDWNKDTVWGTETNYLNAGLLLQCAPETNHTTVGFFPMLYNDCATNGNISPDMLQLWLPPFESCYQMTLVDDKGNSVPKTAKGKALGKPISQPLKIRGGINYAAGYRGRILGPKTPDAIPQPFVLEDYFSITNAGKYHLEFEMQVLKGTKQGPQQYHLPVNVEIEIRKP
jgi:hypothetical protein